MKTKKRSQSKEELVFKKKFYEVMFELDLYNKFKKTYLLDIIQETNYGYYAHLYLATGLSYDDLENKRKKLEQNLNCMWIMKTKNFRDYAEVQIVLRPIDENMEFKNYNVKPHEFYLGLSFSNKLQKADVNKDHCMFLLGGATGSGKTRFIYQILLSWILNCKPEEVEIYLSDVAKNEYVQFKNVKHVKYYASELEELANMMKMLSKEYDRRKKLISKYRERGLATNIFEYNRLVKTNKLSYCYTVIDELSVLLPDKTDSKEEKEMKGFILDTLKKLSKLGRSLGMFTFVATQKTTKDEMPPILKNMSAVRISFRANDLISSEVIMGNNMATGLPTRVAVYSLNGGADIGYLYSPNIITDDGRLQEMLKPYIRNESPTQENLQPSENKDVAIIKTKVTRIPKGVNAREYLDSLKNIEKLSNEGDYNDYGS